MHVILAHVPLQDFNLKLCTYLPGQRPNTKSHLTGQQRLSVLRDPHKMQLNVKPRMRCTPKAVQVMADNQTAKTLRLDYYVLKKHVQQDTIGIAAPPEKGTAAFLGLVPPPSIGAAQIGIGVARN